jgi:hypothetical protein
MATATKAAPVAVEEQTNEVGDLIPSPPWEQELLFSSQRFSRFKYYSSLSSITD